MAWVVYNPGPNSLNVTDIAIPQLIEPFSTADFEAADFLDSRILAAAVGSGQLCIVSFGDFLPFEGWAPVTYPAHPLTAEVSSGESSPLTIAPFSVGTLYLNVTAVASGSLALAWQPLIYDLVGGIAYFGTTPLLSTLTTTQQIAQAFAGLGGMGTAGRFVWTITGSVTFSLSLQMR